MSVLNHQMDVHVYGSSQKDWLSNWTMHLSPLMQEGQPRQELFDSTGTGAQRRQIDGRSTHLQRKLTWTALESPGTVEFSE